MLEASFDETQIEVGGRRFEGANVNYDGNLALSWQTLWVRPVFGRCHHGQHGPAKGSGRQRGAWAGCQRLAAVHAGGQLRSFWQDVPSYLYADSASIAGKYLESIDAHFTRWSVSYNKWTGPLEAGAARLPDASWSAREEEAWRDGTAEEAGGIAGAGGRASHCACSRWRESSCHPTRGSPRRPATRGGAPRFPAPDGSCSRAARDFPGGKCRCVLAHPPTSLFPSSASVVIGMMIRAEQPHRHLLVGVFLDAPAAEGARGIAVDEQPEQQRRRVLRAAAAAARPRACPRLSRAPPPRWLTRAARKSSSPTASMMK